MALAAYLLGHGKVELRLADESGRDGSRIIMDGQLNRYAPWIRSYSGEMYQTAVEIGLGVLQAHSRLRFLLNADGIAATTGSVTLIAEARFKEWVEAWKNCVILEEGCWDMVISSPYKASTRRSRLSVALDDSDDM